MLKPVELIGKKVKLLPLELNHVKSLYEAAKPQEIWTHLPVKIQNRNDVQKLAENALTAKKNGQEFPFVVMDLNTDSIVGSTRFLDISFPNKSLEIGWTWYSPSVWRTGVNTECKYLLLKYCFEELKFNRVQLKTDRRNERSKAAISRLGAVQEGIIRKQMILPDGYVRDSVIFSIIKEEWPSVKQRLEGFLHPDRHKEKEECFTSNPNVHNH